MLFMIQRLSFTLNAVTSSCACFFRSVSHSTCMSPATAGGPRTLQLYPVVGSQARRLDLGCFFCFFFPLIVPLVWLCNHHDKRVNKVFQFNFDFITQFHTVQISYKPDRNITDDLLIVWETHRRRRAGAKNWFSVFLNNRLSGATVSSRVRLFHSHMQPKVCQAQLKMMTGCAGAPGNFAGLIHNQRRSVAYENIFDVTAFPCCVCCPLNEEKHASAIISKAHRCNQCIKSVWSSGSVVSPSKYANTCWFMRLKRVHFMPLFLMLDSTLNILRFWTAGRTERRHSATSAWDFAFVFLPFWRQMDGSCK